MEPALNLIYLEARSLPKLLEDAVRELNKVLLPGEPARATLREKLVVESADLPSLLKDWVVALLNAFYDQQMLFCRCDIRNLGPRSNRWAGAAQAPWRLEAEMTGDLIDPLRIRIMPRLTCRRANLAGDDKGCLGDFLLAENRQ